MAFLQLANIKKTYTVNDETKQDVLMGVDATFERGELIALHGESGCGKSTLLNIIGGLDRDFLGSVIIEKQFLTDFSNEQLDEYRKTRVGMIFQSFNLINNLSVLQNVLLPLKMANTDKVFALERAKKLLSDMGLTDHIHKYPNQLSGGQKQRVAIARALANDPDIILADEPTGNLDSESALAVLDILKEIAKSKKLVIIVTHSELVANNCTRIIKMQDGVFTNAKGNKALTLVDVAPPTRANKPISAFELLKMAFSNLLTQKSRSFFVSLGTSVGIIALVLMLSLSFGLKDFVNKQVAENINLLQIDVTKDVVNTGMSDSAYFTSKDTDYLEGLDGVDHIETSVTINLGATYSYFRAEGTQVADTLLTLSSSYGSFKPDLVYPDTYDMSNFAANKIIISQSLAKKIGTTTNGSVNYSNLIGKTIKITVNSTGKFDEYTIVAITSSDESVSNFASVIIHPSALSALDSSAPITNAYVFAKKASYIDTLVSNISNSLFKTYRQDTTVEDILYYIDLGTVVLIVISAISLLVSAILIFLVLNISITERTKEIGIIRAIGGRTKDVKNIFVFESGLMGVLSGLMGSVFALFVALVANLAMYVSNGYTILSLNPLVYIAGLLISVLVSVVSGLIPSAKAASLDPVESLRKDG